MKSFNRQFVRTIEIYDGLVWFISFAFFFESNSVLGDVSWEADQIGKCIYLLLKNVESTCS